MVVYPALFFAAGWFIAFQSSEVRAFYGGAHGGDVFSHYAWVFRYNPFVYPLEIIRSVLWIAAALPLLRTTRRPWWVGTLHVALWFSLVQNDVHLLPNPLMAPTIQLYHFVETSSSNFIWAWCIGWVLSRSWCHGFGRASSRTAAGPRARSAAKRARAGTRAWAWSACQRRSEAGSPEVPSASSSTASTACPAGWART